MKSIVAFFYYITLITLASFVLTSCGSNKPPVLEIKPDDSVKSDLPEAPTLSASRSGMNIDANWTTVPNASHYEVYKGVTTFPKAAVKVASLSVTDGTSYKNNQVDLGATYYFWVQACNAKGCSPFSNMETVQIQVATTTLSATLEGVTKVKLSWDKVDGATDYQIYRSTGDDGEQLQGIGSSQDASVTSYEDDEITSGFTYSYFVRACTNFGCSDFSPVAIIVVPPGVVSAITVQTNNPMAIDLSWKEVIGATWYEIYRNTVYNLTTSAIIVPKFSQVVYSDQTVNINNNYYYWVKACNISGCSEYSDVASNESAPITAPSLSASLNGASVALNWGDITEAHSYKIYRDTSSDSASASVIGQDIVETSYLDSAVETFTVYYYWIKSCNIGGCSDFSSPVTLRTSLQKPSPTTREIGLTVDLTWDGESSATYYEVYQNSTDNLSAATKVASPLASEVVKYSVNLYAGKVLYYWIKACNYLECSDFSDTILVKLSPQINDTGVAWAGNNSGSGNNASCISDIDASQDCAQGRDALFNDNRDGLSGYSFTKISNNGDELSASATSWSCVRDNVTGLFWEMKLADGSNDTLADIQAGNSKNIHHKDNLYRWGGKTAIGRDYSWDHKNIYFDDWNSLVDGSNRESLCGYNDWRVPTIHELFDILNFTNPSSGTNSFSIDSSYFPNIVASANYWTSSLNNFDSNGVALKSGYIRGCSAECRVILVRGATASYNKTYTPASPVGNQTVKPYIVNDWPDDRYIIDEDKGTVVDTITGLMWGRCFVGMSGDDCSVGSPTMSNGWQNTLKLAADSSFAGYNDWRLPNVKELFSLLAIDRSSPSVNAVAFPGIGSSTTIASTPTGDNDFYGVFFSPSYNVLLELPRSSTPAYIRTRLVRDNR